MKGNRDPENKEWLGFKELQTKFNYQIHHIHKSKLHTYFASDDRYIGSKIGQAAKIGAFDFESKSLAPFRRMFESLTD